VTPKDSIVFNAIHHTHKDLGYLIFALFLIQFLLVLSGGAAKPKLRRALDLIQTVAVRIAGPIIIFAGFYLWHKTHLSLVTWWIWVSFLLWGPMEIVGKRMVRPALEPSDSPPESGKLLLGVSLQLVIILAIFGLMTANAA
jgi:hypothetical protein